MATADGSVSAFHEQPSRGEREPEPPETAVGPNDLPGDTGLRPVSVEPGRRLRDEAVLELDEGPQARPWYSVVSEWRDWYDGYRRAHIEYEGPDGETARTQLENSYQPEYGRRYYAKLKDFERGVEWRWESLTTVMLTFTASNENENGNPRCPADHMRDIAEGWRTCRKLLHKRLSARNWEYARVWEPHESGYGHLHVAIFVEDAGDLEADEFAPVMESYVENTGPAGREAHTLENAVSVNSEVNNLGSYISEYIGIFGDDALERPMKEQMFYAVTWATGTRRVDFSNGAHDVMDDEEWRRETGLRPDDRGEAERRQEGESDAESDGGGGWGVRSICTVRYREPSYADPTAGGVDTTAIAGREGLDPPPEL